MKLEMLDKKVSDIFDAIGRLETRLEEMEDKITKVEDNITCDVDHLLDMKNDSIRDSISSAVSEINSNIDQLKD